MACGMKYLIYLSSQGCFDRPNTKILDIGTQCLLSATVEDLRLFIDKHGKYPSENILDDIEKLSYHSYIRAGERTSYLSELLSLTNIAYTSYDVCAGLSTHLFDLNKHRTPADHEKNFDVVLNFGTTEHIVNQLNGFKVIHDATAEGGFVFHQVPSTGYVNHGYFTYHYPFFVDIATENDYEIIDYWWTFGGASDLISSEWADVRLYDYPDLINSDTERLSIGKIPNSVINVLMKKMSHKPFRLPLELATAHSDLTISRNSNVASGYNSSSLSFIELEQFSFQELALEIVNKTMKRIKRFKKLAIK